MLAFFGRELRAQWPMLLGYALTAFVSLAGVISLGGSEWLLTTQRARSVLGWFVLVGVLGAALILAPSAVRNEFQGRDDQFVRRLPGALRPAFAAKLWFVLLGGAVLAVLGILLGHLFLSWQHGQLTGSRFAVHELWSGLLWLDTEPARAAGFAACVLPWVLAVACWMPGARMAVGAALVLFVALAMVVNGVLMTCRGLDKVLVLEPWLVWFALTGIAVAWVSFVRGRRGGSSRRSAVLGAATAIIGLLPPAGYLGYNAFRFHFPDISSLSHVGIQGLEPTNRFALVEGASIEGLQHGALLRVDLQNGDHERIASPGGWPHSLDAARQLWVVHNGRGALHLDLATGERFGGEPIHSPDELRRVRAAMRRLNRRVPIANVRGVTVSFEGAGLRFDGGDSEPTTVDLNNHQDLRVVGDGLLASGGACLDFVTRRWCSFERARKAWCIAVDGSWLIGSQPGFTVRRAAGGDPWTWDPTQGEIVGALPSADGRALLIGTQRRLWVFDPSSCTATPVLMPADLPELAHSSGAFGHDLRQVDGSGGVWLHMQDRKLRNLGYLRVDPAAATATVVPWNTFNIVAADGDWLIGGEAFRTIERRNWRTGERVQIFPKPR